MSPLTEGPEILMFAMGTAGDIHPYIAVAKGLRARGHRVTLVANSYFETTARQAGIELLSSGSAEEYRRVIENPQLWDFRTGYRLMFEKLLDAMTFAYRVISERPRGRTIVVAPSTAFGARIAQEKLNVPLVSMNVETNIFRSAFEQPGANVPEFLQPFLPPFRRVIMAAIDRWVLDPPLMPRLNRFRADLGLSPVRRIMREWIHSPQAVIGLFPEWFAPKQPDWPPNLHLTGFPIFDEAEVRQTPIEASEFLDAGEAPIVFTLGTGMLHAKEFFRKSVDVCKRLNRRGILLTQFSDQTPPELPPTVRHFSYLPFSSLLPRVAALVHHGGIGTTAQALRAGIPQLITPMVFDQPDNAARLKKLGVGDLLRPRDYQVDPAARKLDQLTTSTQVAARCLALSRKFAGADPVAAACLVIESIALPAQAPRARAGAF